MCFSCWEEYKKPKIKNQKVLKMVELLKYDYFPNAHVVFEDWNLYVSSIKNSLKWNEENKKEILDDVYLKTKEALLFFKKLSIKERASALAIHEKFFI